MAAQPVAGAWPVLVALPAEIDITNARDVRSQLIAAALKTRVRVVIGDMTLTRFCDSTGVRALIFAHRWAVLNGTELRLLRPGRAVRRALELVGADQVLTICESLKQAAAP
jgi:anti-sigma B factor antagonist